MPDDHLATAFEDALADLVDQYVGQGLDRQAVISALELRKMVLEEDGQ